MMTKMEAGKTSAEIVEEGSRSKSGIETSQLNSGQSVVTMAISDDAKETNHRYCKHSRLECPKFEGDDFDGWLMKLEQYFEVEKIPDENKVRTVLMQLEGRALHWHQFYAKANGGLSALRWFPYLAEMRKRFAASEFSDPMSELVSLRQSNTVEEYYEQFLAILNSLQLSPEYTLSIFTSNLKPEIAKTVRLFYPQTIMHAFNLARQIESLTPTFTRKPYIPYKTPPPAPPNISSPTQQWKSSQLPPLLPTPNISPLPSVATSPTLTLNTPLKTINTTQPSNFTKTPAPTTRQERDERRRKGLCMWCGLKYSANHACVKSQLYNILVDNHNSSEAETEEFLDCVDSMEEMDTMPVEADTRPAISLHAMIGTVGYQTMRIQGKVKNQLVIFLVDTGSTHNFVSNSLIKRIGGSSKTITSLTITVANGEQLKTHELCPGLHWEAQGVTQAADFLVLPLRGCDAVLGIQWLLTLGPILWDFQKLTMQFTWGGQQVIWHGLQPGQVLAMSRKQTAKVNNSSKTGAYTMLLTSVTQATLQMALTSTGQMPSDLQQLLNVNFAIFEVPRGLPPTRPQDHRIHLFDETQTIKVRPYRYPAVQKNELEKMVDEMLEAGVIRNSNSSFASPVVLVKKKDGSWRFCVDYRQLNKLTVKDKFPIPLVEELLDELVQAAYFSKLDLRSGYHQIRMHESDIHKTAFRTHQGHYEFLVMPFGLTNAPSTFQSLMNTIFKPFLRHFVLVFFDDILVYSPDWESHLVHLQMVFDVLQQNRLYVKLSKCDFGATKMEYLGHIISRGVVSMDASKVACMIDWPCPQSTKELRGFLGLTGYYRRFIRDYGTMARPLTDLLKKNGFLWSASAQTAFETLKKALITAPVLVLPDFTQEFIVEADASSHGIGAVLSQGVDPWLISVRLCRVNTKLCLYMRKK